MQSTLLRKDVVMTNRIKYLSMMASSYPETSAWTNSAFKLYEEKMAAMTENISTVEIQYDRDEFGRLQPEKSSSKGLCLTRMSKDVRHWLIPEKMVDIDIANAMPSILCGVAEKHRIRCYELKKFVHNYYAYMHDLGNVCDNAKEVRSRLFSGCAFRVKAGLPSWCKDVRDDAMMIAGELRDYYPEIWDMAVKKEETVREEMGPPGKKSKTDDYVDNTKGVFLSYLYQKFEGEVLDKIDSAGRSFGYWDDRVSLMYDGLLVYSLKEIDLERVKAYVNHETGFALDIVIKPTETNLGWTTHDIPRPVIVTKDKGHTEAAKIMMMALDGKYVKDATLNDYVLSDGGVWYRNEKEKKDELFKYCDGMQFVRKKAIKASEEEMDEDGEDAEYLAFGSIHSNCTSIVNSFRALAPVSYHVDDFAAKVISESVGKIAFLDGYWQFCNGPQGDDGIYGRFVKGGRFNTFNKISCNFPKYNHQDVDEVMNRVFIPIFDNSEEGAMDFFLTGLARAIAGHGDDKRTYLMLGPRNSGKSLIFQLVDTAIRSYCVNVPSSVFAARGGPSGDAYLSGSFMVGAELARVIKSSELPVGTSAKDKPCFDGNKIKNLQSMKEGVKARGLYERERVYYSMATAFFMFNDNPTFHPADSIQMCQILELQNEFVMAEEKDKNEITRTNKRLKVRDVELEELCRSERYANAFLWIMFQSYKPHALLPLEGNQYHQEAITMGQGDDIYHDVFTVTRSRDDSVRFSDLKKELENAGCTDNQAAMGRNLRRIIEGDFKENGYAVPDDIKYACKTRGVDRDKWFYRYIQLNSLIPPTPAFGMPGPGPRDGNVPAPQRRLPENFSMDEPYENSRGAYSAGFIPPESKMPTADPTGEVNRRICQINHNEPGKSPKWVVREGKGRIVFGSDDMEQINKWMGFPYVDYRRDENGNEIEVFVHPITKKEVVLEDKYKGYTGKQRLEYAEFATGYRRDRSVGY